MKRLLYFIINLFAFVILALTYTIKIYFIDILLPCDHNLFLAGTTGLVYINNLENKNTLGEFKEMIILIAALFLMGKHL